MRILKVANIPNSRNTGMGRVMHSTADELRELGHHVDFLFSEDVPRRFRGRGDRFTFPVALVRAVKQKIAHTGTYDIVEIHEPSAAWYCHARRKDPMLPACVIMSHGVEENYWQHRLKLDAMLGRQTSLKSRLLVPATLLSQARYGLRHAEQVMCLNSLDEAYLKEIVNIPKDKISKIQNGVDARFFVQTERTSGRLPRLLFVGSWLDNKGRHIIPIVFKKVTQKHPAITLSLLGTGLSSDTVMADFSPETHRCISVKPRVDDVQLREAYAQHDIFILPSHFESWGLTLLEAAAANMAIVAGRAGGPQEIFQDGENALLVSATDAEALAEAITRLINSPGLRLSLGEKAQARARQFTWRAAAESHLRAYERALQVAQTSVCGQPVRH